jgi:Asp-tRNA(Asn)/Glu-tRNA(Gln) amidotransferase A subunit family amidase
MPYRTASDLLTALRAQKVSSVELVETVSARIQIIG